MAKKAIDVVKESREKLVKKIIENLEKGHGIWKQDWKVNKALLLPYNPISKSVYQGINRVYLGFGALENSYDDPRWVTFKQAQEKGFKLKKEQHGVVCEKWIWEKLEKVIDKDTGKQKIDEIGKKVYKKVELERPICTYFVLFNAKQFENFPELEKQENEIEQLSKDERELAIYDLADNFIQSSECKIEEIHLNKNCYIPNDDRILIVPRINYKSAEGFLGTLLHEMSHSTGHESRLNRKIKNRFGSNDYAMEELVAELSCTFLEAELNINLDFSNTNHLDYLGSWIDTLKENPKILYEVAKEASKATEYLLENYERVLQKLQKNEEIDEYEEISV